MNRRTRVGSTIDMVRLSNAVSRPGIDPRIWCSLAFALDESQLDAEHGDFVDVKLLPTELEVTARVPQAFAGSGFGSNKGRIHKDDEVVVLFPDGDPAAGGIIVARLWSASDPPPDDVANAPEDIIEVLEDGLNWLTKTQGSDAKATLESENVRLGDRDATESLILGTSFRSQQQTMDNQLGSQLSTAGGFLTAAGADPVLAALAPIAAASLISAGSAVSAAGAAVTAFESAASANQDYRSNVSKTK